jgi:WD40 repeat protein
VTATIAAPASPYKGLSPFEDSELDALLFFGRERESEVIAANLIASRVTVLYGPSGVGKSSVLRAGVAYRLRREQQAGVIVFSSWAGDPTRGLIDAAGGQGDSMADALADAADREGGDLYVILDQFEECFLYHRDGGGFAQELAQVLRRGGLRVNVLVGIREDALARLDVLKASIPNLLSNRLRLERLDRLAGAAATNGPIARYNELAAPEERVEIEAQLEQAVLDEVTAGRVELGASGRGIAVGSGDENRVEAPYLQLVLARLWEVEHERGSRTLRLATLRELGGAAQIVQDHLERAMAELSAREKGAAAEMYNFLVTPSGSKIAHGVRDLAGYAQVDEVEAEEVLRRLTAERIVRASSENGPSTTRYEIFHDVLADAVIAWRNRYVAEHALREAERRRRRALLVAAAALAGLLLVAGIAVLALVERGHSRTDARRARAAALASEAAIQLRVDPQRSLRLARDAARVDPGTQQETVLRSALVAARLRAVLPAGSPVHVAGFSPDGSRFAAGTRGGQVRIYDARTLSLQGSVEQGGPVTAAEFGPDGSSLLSAGRDGSARLWRASDRTELRSFAAGGPVRFAFLAAQGRTAVTLTARGLVRVWRTRDGHLVHSFRTRRIALPRRAAIDPSGSRLVAAGLDRRAFVYALPSGRLLQTLRQRGFVTSLAFSPNGQSILTAGYEGRARLWNARRGRLLRELRGPDRSALGQAVFSRDGTHVVAAGNDGTVRVWESRTGDPIGIAVGHAYQVTHVAFDPTGNSVASGSSDGSARVWSREGRLLSLLSGHGGAITALVFSPDGKTLLTASDDGDVRIWNPSADPELEVIARIPHPKVLVADGSRDVAVVNGTTSMRVFRVDGKGLRRPVILRGGTVPPPKKALSPDGRIQAIGRADGTVDLLDPRTGRRVRRIPAHTMAVTSVAFSPDGKRLVTASLDKDVRIWSVRTGKELHLLRWHFGPVAAASFSADGRWVLTAGPGTAGLGSAATGERIVFLRGHTRPLVGAVFTGRDGRTIVTAAKDGTIRSWRCGLCGGVDELISLATRRLR